MPSVRQCSMRSSMVASDWLTMPTIGAAPPASRMVSAKIAATRRNMPSVTA